jgi:molybdenum cofactor biosynthesis enzyme MoaA
LSIDTLDLIAGTMACDAVCPFCVARMTPTFGVGNGTADPSLPRFDEAFEYAIAEGISTVIITGKGEPTLFPEQITAYLRAIRRHNFGGSVELQTNGIGIADHRDRMDDHLGLWRELGLERIAVSIVHWESERNREIYRPHSDAFPDLAALIGFLRSRPYLFSVRLTCVALNGYIDSADAVESLIAFTRNAGVDQLTLRPVAAAENALDPETARFARSHALSADQLKEIRTYLEQNGRIVRRAAYGGMFYDLGGIRVALTACLTKDASAARRHALYFPDGSLRMNWESETTIDLGERRSTHRQRVRARTLMTPEEASPTA